MTFIEKSGVKEESSGGVKGFLNSFLARNITFIINIAGKRLKKRYDRAAKDLFAAQMRVLEDILNYSKNTVYGREHDFESIKSHKEYVSHVKAGDYEDFRPYINRHVKGEDNVLFPDKPVIYTRTSGTTAEPKLIPVTEYNFKRIIKKRGLLWLYGLMEQFQDIYSGKDLTLVSPAVDGYTEGGVPYGALSGFVYQHIPDFVKRVHSIPYEVLCIKDFNARAYTMLRMAVPANITGIYTGNPATVLNLAQKADLWRQQIIKDVREGTLNSDFNIEPDIRKKVEGLLEPASKRADQLQKIADSSDIFRPADYWPNLKLVHTWTNGNCSLVIPKLKPWYGNDVPIMDFGYIASEITATDLVDVKSNSSLLAVLSGFYEFSSFEDGDDPTRFYMAHELEAGRKYYIYITTYSGLYRYNMNDVIEVTGHYYQVPLIKFLYKGNGITSIQGEKISERQFMDSIAEASSEINVEIGFFAGFADAVKNRYELYVEFKQDLTKSEMDAFSIKVDSLLKDKNIEYDGKRKSERLNLPVTIPLVNDAFAEFRALRLRGGAFEGQLKWIHLFSEQSIKQHILQLVKPDHIKC